MQMKVFHKGQIVIPAQIRKALGIKAGNRIEVELDREHSAIQLHKLEQYEARDLAGSLSNYAAGKAFPTREEMHKALREGLTDG
ncbi:MAG: AbrB/MazE/SpoVT family DNA-binding domain-containing protein [Lentisphaeria bacterium]